MRKENLKGSDANHLSSLERNGTNPANQFNRLKWAKSWRIPKRSIDKIFIYEKSPTKEIAVEVEALSTISLPSDILWELTKGYSGVAKEFFDKYFQGKDGGDRL